MRICSQMKCIFKGNISFTSSNNTSRKLSNLMLSDNFKILDTLFYGVTESRMLAKFMMLIALLWSLSNRLK